MWKCPLNPVVRAVALAVLSFGATACAVYAACPTAVSISDPIGGTIFSYKSNIAVGGTGVNIGDTFVVRAVDANGTVLQSANATIDSNWNWAVTLNAPTGGWPKSANLDIEAVCGGTTLDSVPVQTSSN
jgi:hypothetical protein